MYNTTWPYLFLKIFYFLTSTLLPAQNTTLLSKVQRRFFSNFVAFSENPDFKKKPSKMFWPHFARRCFPLWVKINVFISICNHHYYKGNKLPQQSLYDPFFSYQFEDATFENIITISKFIFRFLSVLRVGSGGLWSF